MKTITVTKFTTWYHNLDCIYTATNRPLFEVANADDAEIALAVAAPDLLSALEELSRLVHQNNALQRAGIEVCPKAWGQMHNVNKLAIAAIAKAKEIA